MATEIIESLMAQSGVAHNDQSRNGLSYYERVNEILKRTRLVMGKTNVHSTVSTTIASTINATIISNNKPTTIKI